MLQTVFPFLLSATIVIIITVIAEKYGTKIGGIIGGMPSTIIVAYVFIAINRGLEFASDSASIVPAEMGINVVFVFLFALIAFKSKIFALVVSFICWTIMSAILFYSGIDNISISVAIYVCGLVSTFYILEKKIKAKSVNSIKVHYTPLKIALRGVLAGTVISISVMLSNFDPTLSGISAVFPAIFASTMIISLKEHGPVFSAGIAKSMILGSISIMGYAVSIYFFYEIYDLIIGSIVAFCISLLVTLTILKLRKKIK
ncbi:MAG: DUF3147 family protein [Candidatus Thermoplasmatota archaeon]|nr:DUF3147 family protein [Candidatus Thermoplasmatota archaeon]